MAINFAAGRAKPASAALTDFWHSAADLFYKDVRVQVQHGNTVAPTANDYVGSIVRRIDAGNMIIGAVTGTTLHVMKIQGGTLWDLQSVALPANLVAGTPYWLRTIANGNQITVEHWNSNPRLGGAPARTMTYNLTAPEIALFSGNYTFGVGGFFFEQNNWGTAYIEDIYYEPVKMADMLIMDVIHVGSYTARPIIEFIGGQGDITLENLANGSTMIITGNIPAGKSYFADVKRRTFYDELGNNVYDQWATASKWIKLEEGHNPIVITTQSNDGSSGIRVTWRSSWV